MALDFVGIEMVARGSDMFFRAMEKGDRAVDKFGRGVGEASKASSKAFDQMAKGANERIGHLVADGFVRAGGAVLKFIGGSVDAAGQFQATMNKFSSIAGDSMAESGKGVQEFSALFMKMGADTAFSAKEAGDAAVELAKGGRSATQVFKELPDALALAAAGEVGLAQAAELSAKQLGIWEDTGVTSTKVADMLTQAANASTVGVQDLGLGLANVGGVAKLAGLSFDETVTTLAQLAPGFSSASDAGTSFKAFLNNLIPTTDPAAQMMKKLGLYTEETGSKFYDASGQFIGMEKASQLLYTSTKDLSEAERSLALETIFGSDAQRAAAIIAEDGEKGYRKMAQSMGKAGSATEQAAERNQGYVYAMDQLTGSLETFQIVLGEKVLPAVTAVIKTGADLVNFATDALAGFDGLQPVIVGVGAATLVYATVQLPAMIGAVTTAIPLLYAKAAALTASLGPLALVAVAVGGVTAAWNGYNDKIETATQQTLNSRKWWLTSADALALYEQQSKDVQGEIKREAEALRENRLALEAEMDSLGRRMTLNPDADWTAEIEALNVKARAIKANEQALRTEIKAYQDGKPIIRDSIGMSYASRGGFLAAAEGARGFAQAAGLSKEQLEKFLGELDKINEAGARALSTTQQTQLDWLQGSEKRYSDHVATLGQLNKDYHAATTDAQRESIAKQIEQEQASYAQQTHDANVFYAQQRQAQQAAYGEQLIAYVQNQRDMGKIGKDEAAALIGELTTQYGVAADSSVLLWDKQKASIDRWAQGSDQSAQKFVGSMLNSQLAASRFEQELNRRVDLAVAGLETAGLSAGELDKALGSIRSEVRTKMILEGFGEAKEESIGMGYALVSGLAKGVNQGTPLVTQAVDGAIGAAYAAAAQKYGIRSPSRFFAEKLGLPLIEGVAVGIDAGLPSAFDALLGGLGHMGQASMRMVDRIGGGLARRIADWTGGGWDIPPPPTGHYNAGGGNWGLMPTAPTSNYSPIGGGYQIAAPATPSQIATTYTNQQTYNGQFNINAVDYGGLVQAVMTAVNLAQPDYAHGMVLASRL